MAGKIREEATEPRITSKLFDRGGRERRIGRDVLFLRPSQHVGDPEPEPDDRPVVRTSPPAIAVQLKPEESSDCPPEDELRAITNAFRSLIAGILRNIEVRSRCEDGVVTIAIWLDSAPTHTEAAARERSLQLVSQLEEGEMVAMYLTVRALRALAQTEFDRLFGPQYRLAADGSRSADGPIHLERITVDLEPRSRIITRVEGFDDRPWPDVDFTANITDTISLENRAVRCTEAVTMLPGLVCESTPEVDVDEADAALAAALGILTIPFFGIGFFFLGALAGAGGPDDGLDAGEDGGGVGCALARLVQMPIPRPEREAVRIRFERAEVRSSAVLFGGTLANCARTPRVTIEGPNSFTISIERRSVSATYRAETAETFGNLRFQWSATHASVRNPTARSTQITFNLGGPVQNSVTESEITLIVTDGDGALPPVRKRVRIRLTSIPPQPQRPGNDDPDRQPL